MALTDNIVAYWKLDGDSTDSVNSHNGTDTSMTYNTANGKINSGGVFSGSSKILVADSTDWTMGNGDFTISIWIKRSVTGTREIFIGQVNSGGSNTSISFLIEFTALNYIQTYFGVGAALVTITSSNTITDTNWHHIVYRRISTTLELFCDNISVGSASIGTSTMNDSTNKLGIGVGGELTSLLFRGSMDEIGIWKGKGLSNSEISELYNSGLGLQYPFISSSNFFQLW